MNDSELICGLDDFLDKALSLKIGEGVEYGLPRRAGNLARIQVRYERPISLHFGVPEYGVREVLWSPMQLRKYVLKQMGVVHGRFFGWNFVGWRRQRIVKWWAREWAGCRT